MNSRRKFLQNTLLASAALGLPSFVSAESFRELTKKVGANDQLNYGLIGCKGMGWSNMNAHLKIPRVNCVALADIDQNVLDQRAADAEKITGKKPRLYKDYRQMLEDKDIDVVIVGTPDHWHCLNLVDSLAAGKHVYVEKPCSHNAREGELLVEYQKKYNKVIQMGNQQRSSQHSIEIINDIHNGVIGKAYMAKAFYTSGRGEVPVPVKAAPPEGLDWDLFQGPSPRKEYMHDTWDYNWHWYGWDFGTAESGNNATHELDVARWALQTDFPKKVIVDAGKYHWVNDGWTMYDTMDATFKFDDEKTIKWDGKSRNGQKTYGSDRGTIIYGTEGSVYVDRGQYKLFDRGGKLIRDSKSSGSEGSTNLGGGGDMSTMHVVNFFESIRGKDNPNSPIDEGAKSTLLCHLANIASRTGEILECDPSNGHITNSRKAKKLWSREYEKGWEPSI